MDKALFIFGPTAVGKSDMAIALAKKFDGEVVSCDSVQVFRGFDIGSAKISQSEMQGVTHHAIDICDGNSEFSVGQYVQMAKSLIKEINSRSHLAIIVGGTGLYIDALLGDFDFGKTDKHASFRAEIEAEIEKNGLAWAQKKLLSLDKTLAEKTDCQNPRRLVRAIEIATFGKAQTNNKPSFDHLLYGLTMPREELYSRINSRVDKMVKSGLVDEVKGLISSGVDSKSQGMRAIGYKEVVAYLNGELRMEDAIGLIKQHSRNYAKRQLTFMRGLERKYGLKTVDVANAEQALEEIEKGVKQWLKA